jgi:hypothetical protein
LTGGNLDHFSDERRRKPKTTSERKTIMHPQKDMEEIIGGKRYSVQAATLIASDEYWDGHNHERGGRNTFLYRTPNGAYFTVNLTQWQGERDSLTPVTQAEAIELYEHTLPEHEVEYSEAFPDVTITDA